MGTVGWKLENASRQLVTFFILDGFRLLGYHSSVVGGSFGFDFVTALVSRFSAFRSVGGVVAKFYAFTKVLRSRYNPEGRAYLCSPVDGVWPHSNRYDDAHHFDSRREAKDTIVKINGGDKRILNTYEVHRVDNNG